MSLLLLLAVALVRPAGAAEVPSDFVDELVTGGFDRAVNFDFLPDGRMIVVEQRTARLRLVVGGAIAAVDPVGTIPDIEIAGEEAGLLGVAVDPRWPLFPYVYVYGNTSSSPNLRLTRYTLTGDLAFAGDGSLVLDPESSRDILADIPDDYPLHNGGTVTFGPDGMLYLGIGEDGVPCAAQDLHELRGKVLRLDVRLVPAGPGPAPSYQSLVAAGNPWSLDWNPRARLVWLRGLRNPFGFEIDQLTGELVIADVGNTTHEEVDLAPVGGLNFGWPIYEGPRRFDFPCDYPDTGAITPPAFWYQRVSPEVEAAVMLGAAYRRPVGVSTGFPFEYEGSVFIYDFYEGSLRRLIRDGVGGLSLASPAPGQPTANAWATGLLFATRMRPGPDGSLWYFEAGAELRRIRYTGTVDASPVGPVRIAMAAFPVPSRGPVRIEYDLVRPARTGCRILDAAGRTVRTLRDPGSQEAGRGILVWDGRDDSGDEAAPGLYFACLTVDDQRLSRRLVRIRG